MVPKKRVSPHPGEILLEEFLRPMDITMTELARHTGIDLATISNICRGRRDITPEAALKLGAALGVEPETWHDLQAMHNFTKAREALRHRRRLPRIKMLPKAQEAAELAAAGAPK